MKQHITIEQLKESSFEQYKTLVKYFVKHEPKNFEQLIKSDYKRLKYSDIHWLTEKITIGKMIEILEEKGMHPVINYTSKIQGHLRAVELSRDREFTDVRFVAVELVTALWAAVKDFL